MVTSIVRIPCKQFGELVRIRPISDIHLGNTYCDEKAARAFLSDPTAYYIGLGDMLDGIITTDVKRYRKSSDATNGDAIIDEQVNKLFTWLEPIKSRILGLGSGNHEDVITAKCGTNPVQRLCDMLGVKYLGYSWLVRIAMDYKGHVDTLVVRGHHGWGGGSRTQGADLTKYSKDMQHWDADVFLYGHVHRRQIDSVPRLNITRKGPLRWSSEPKLMAICGTFLKTYSDGGDPTYSEIKGYPPVEVGGVTLNVQVETRPHRLNCWFDI